MTTDNNTGDHLVNVRFALSSQVEATRVSVVGEFNDWDPDVDPLERDDDSGEYVTIIALPRGRSYRYRYLIDGTRWENDWHADSYVPNEFGGDDSVVQVHYDAAAVGEQLRREVTANTDLPPMTSSRPGDLIAPTNI